MVRNGSTLLYCKGFHRGAGGPKSRLMSLKDKLDDAAYHMGTGCIMAPIAFIVIASIVTCIYALIQYIAKQPGFQDGMVITVIIVYVLFRFIILAVKILVPYFCLRYLIQKCGWNRKLYLILIAVAIAAISTSGIQYRKYRREHPEVVAEWNKDLDENAPVLGRLIHYEAYRMMYDLNRLTE